MKKSVVKRIKITKQKKIIRRPMAVDHFRTKKSRKLLRQKRKKLGLDISKKEILNY